MRVQLLQPNAYDADQVSLDTGLECTDASLTKQSFAVDADINTIVERFGQGDYIPDGYQPPAFQDFTEVVDFHTAMNAVRASGESFMELPAKLRERFNNDPQSLMSFLGDKTNLPEAVSLGLVSPQLDPSSAAPAASPAAGGGTSSST